MSTYREAQRGNGYGGPAGTCCCQVDDKITRGTFVASSAAVIATTDDKVISKNIGGR